MIKLDQRYARQDFIDFLQDNFLQDYVRDVRPVGADGHAIHKATSLGRSEALDLQVFEFEYSGSASKRVALTKEAFQIMKQSATFNALAVFYGQDNDDWRLSFLTANAERTEKGRAIVAYSNPRRYSFFLGPNAKINTPNRFLIKDGQIKNFDDLLARFNVEIVTKEFFENYKKLFDRLLAYLNKDHAFQSLAGRNGVKTANFAKKLLGQIVFLYFLQRKGWLGAKKSDSISMGDKDFLRSLFNKSVEKKENFYNTYLEPLFYGALNKPPEKAGSYYRTYFDCQIPFLNGGLFESPQDYDWEHEFLLLPDKLFSKDPNNPSHGEGILDIFDLYNFTVDESDFLDKEVSVDPEMLGKVFENLLEENLRKGKGTYYTPREIVNYMCKESVVNYLATKTGLTSEDIKNKYFPAYNVLGDEKLEIRDVSVSESIVESLKNIRVVDPACGSGAFLVGMLQQITHLRFELEEMSKLLGRRISPSSEYEIKKQTIQNCIYGADIDSGAVDIAKLRLWLSLVVDYNLEEIEPLPNLDYKIMVGNSLIEKLDTNFLAKGLNGKKNDLIDELKELKNKYFSSSESKEKTSLRLRINEIIRLLVNYDNEQEREKVWAQILGRKNQIKLFNFDDDQQSFADINSYTKKLEGLKDFTEIDHFEWHLNFNEVFEKGGFDIVIANPPYGADIDRFTKIFAKLYPNTTKAFKDIYKIFIELGLSKLLKQKGILCYIIPNTLLLQPRYKDVRAFLLKHRIIEILNLGEEVFEQVVVPTCVIFIRDDDPANNIVKFGDLASKSIFTGDLMKIEHKEIEQNIYKSTQDNIFVESFRELKNDEQNLEEIINFKDAGINYQRVNVGLGEKGKSDLGQRLLYEGLQKDSEDEEYWKGEDIEPYFIKRKTDRFVKLSTIKNLRNNERAILNKNYFKLAPKLVWRQTAPYMIAALDEKGIWFGRSIQSGIIKDTQKNNFDYRYLLALLNSKYLRHLYSQFVNEEGRVFPQVKLAKLRKLPVKTTSISNQKPFTEIVDKTLALTSSNDYLSSVEKQTKVKNYENQIDQLVYKLYGLTPEEIEIIESRT